MLSLRLLSVDVVEFMVCFPPRYTAPTEVARNRSFFATGRRDFMLFTERFHFFRRYRIKGAKNIVFYGLPQVDLFAHRTTIGPLTHGTALCIQYGHFYPEILNSLSDAIDTSCTVIYTKFDAYQLQAVAGSERANLMLSSSKNIHMFC